MRGEEKAAVMPMLQWILQKLSSLFRLNLAGLDADKFKFLDELPKTLICKEYDKAHELLLRAIKLRDNIADPTTVNLLLTLLSGTWLLTERYEEAISFFSSHITRYPQDWAALRGRAGALWYSGKLQDAIKEFSRALELKPDDFLSLSGRGQVLAEIGESQRALDDLNLALQKIKETPETLPGWKKWYEQIEAGVRNGRAVALAGLGEHRSAMREFELSIRLTPDNAWVYYNRAAVFDRGGNREKALLDYQTALKKDSPPLNPIRRERTKARICEIPS